MLAMFHARHDAYAITRTRYVILFRLMLSPRSCHAAATIDTFTPLRRHVYAFDAAIRGTCRASSSDVCGVDYCRCRAAAATPMHAICDYPRVGVVRARAICAA